MSSCIELTQGGQADKGHLSKQLNTQLLCKAIINFLLTNIK